MPTGSADGGLGRGAGWGRAQGTGNCGVLSLYSNTPHALYGLWALGQGPPLTLYVQREGPWSADSCALCSLLLAPGVGCGPSMFPTLQGHKD